MKAAVYADRNKVELRDVPVGEVGPDQIKVKVAFCALCATDVHVVTQGLYGLPYGMIVGHEASGTVVELGERAAASGLKVGDHVAAIPLTFCGQCQWCRKGLVMHCVKGFDVDSEPMGCMAEYRIYNPVQVLKIPDNVSLEKAALVEPLTCVVRAMELAKIGVGSTVALSGAGGIGLLLLLLIKLQGATRITVIEPVEAKRKLALEVGADFVIDPYNQDIYEEAMKITDDMGFDFVFEASGVPKAAPPCLKIIGKFGCAVYFAVYPMDYELPVNLFDLYSKEARIQTVFTSPYLFPRALELAAKLDLDKVMGPVYPLDRVADAFAAFHSSQYPKILIKCSE